MNRASIVGCGWLGLALAKRWTKRGLSVIGTTTRSERIAELEAAGVQALRIAPDMSWTTLPPEDQLLVITIPPRRLHPERLAVYPQRVEKLAQRATSTANVIYLSSTGVYGNSQGDVDETSIPAPVSVSSRAVLEAEQRLRNSLAERLAVLRLGGLVGPDRHPGRWFAGKKNAPNGDAPVNLVHRNDVCDAVDAVVQNSAFGCVFNVVAAEHPTKRAYYTSVCERFGFDAPNFQTGGAQSKRVFAEPIYALLKRRIELPL